MFQINKIEDLTAEVLHKMLNKYRTGIAPILQKMKNYYDGNQAICSKTYSDETKSNSRIVTNYCASIVKNYAGYIAGKPITYTSNSDISEITENFRYNDSQTEDNHFLEDALIYGVAYELHWLDKDGVERFSTVSPLSSFAIYDNTLESDLLAFARWYQVNQFVREDEFQMDLYTANEIIHYFFNSSFGTLTEIGREPHFYGQVPVAVFNLNRDNVGIFAPIISLQDAYNEALSSTVDDWSSFCDSYMVLTGVSADADDLAAMKESRVIQLPPSDASVQYLTKTANDTEVQNLLGTINDNIHLISASPDFNDEKFLAQSGIAMRYKLVGFTNSAGNVANNMRKALLKRVELVSSIMNLKGYDMMWRDIDITFTYNLPEDISETVTLIQGLQGIVSNHTLLGKLDFIDDVDEELALVQEENKSKVNLYPDLFSEEEDDGELLE